MSSTKIQSVFGAHPNIGFVSIFYSFMDSPLGIWQKQERLGRIRRLADDDTYPALRISTASNIYHTYITTPSPPFTSLGIKLQHLIVILKNMGKSVAFVVQIRDEYCKRRFIFSTCYGTQRIKHLCSHVPIYLHKDWNELALDLASLTRKAYGTTYQETVRVQVHANCRLRMIYFSEVPSETTHAAAMMKVILNRVAFSTACISTQLDSTMNYRLTKPTFLCTNTYIEKTLSTGEDHFKIKSAMSDTIIPLPVNALEDSAPPLESKSCPQLEYDGKVGNPQFFQEELRSLDFQTFLEDEKMKELNTVNANEHNLNLTESMAVSVIDKPTEMLYEHDEAMNEITHVPNTMNRGGHTLTSDHKLSETDLDENEEVQPVTHEELVFSVEPIAEESMEEVDNQIAEIELMLKKMVTHRARCVARCSVSSGHLSPRPKGIVNEMKLKIEQMRERLNQLEAAFESTEEVPSGAIQIVSEPFLSGVSLPPSILRTSSSVGKLKPRLSVTFAPIILEEDEPLAQNQHNPPTPEQKPQYSQPMRTEREIQIDS